MDKVKLIILIFFCIPIYGVKGQKTNPARAEAVACTTPTVSISADYCTDPDKVILTANSPDTVSYLWSNGATSQSITVDVVGNYSVTATTTNGGCNASAQISVGQELVTNGDFTEGNVGFTSGYAYKADTAGYNKELYDDSGNNGYGVGTNGQNYHPSFYGKDHTNNQTGARNFMLVNGHGSIVVWEETVSVEPNTNYYYSAWGMNLNPTSPARLQFEVNGEKIGTIADLNNAPKPSSNWQVNLNNWERFYYGNTTGWNSGSATTAVIRIIDLNGDLNGNDFGLDDISFASLAPFLIGPAVDQELCPGESIDAVTYQVGSGGPPSVTGLPHGVSYTFDGLNLVISGTPDTVGTFNFTVSTTGCTNPLTKSGTITVKNPGVWTGTISCDWNNPGNWCCDILPTSTTNVEINSGLTNYPVIYDTDTGFCKNLFIDNNASVIVSNGGALQVHGDISNSGVLNSLEGTMEMSGSSAQTISGSDFLSNTIKNLTVSNTSSAGLSISSVCADTLKISGTLSFGTDSSKLSTGDNIDLLSTDTATANVGIVNPGNTITGEVIVDRYINMGSSGETHSKAWQLLATPTYGQTVKESWMEDGRLAPGYGTQITSPSGTSHGFDYYSPAMALKYYNPAGNNWIEVSNANDTLYNPIGYLLFLRGDRTITSPYAAATPTILRSKGSLICGNTDPIAVSPDHFQSIGNPYASNIDFTKVTKDAGVDNLFYAFDPYLFGSYGFGGYQTITSVNDWKPVPGGTFTYQSSIPDSIIQSGQAFFVHATAAASYLKETYNVSFSENCKVAEKVAKNFTRTVPKASLQGKMFIRASIFAGGSSGKKMADGNAAAFSHLYSNKVDRNDAIKMPNAGENFDLLRNGKLLAVEALAPINLNDTLFYYISNVRQQTYRLCFTTENLDGYNLQPVLVDSYTNVYTPLSLEDSTFIPVSFSAAAASRSPTRFKLIFREMPYLPVRITSLNVTIPRELAFCTWKTLNDYDVSKYEIQHSTDGIHFETIVTIQKSPADHGNYTSVSGKPANGVNYYRICIIDERGNKTYSNIKSITVVPQSTHISDISVYPNPIENSEIHLHFSKLLPGNYQFRLINPIGEEVLSRTFYFSGGSGRTSIMLPQLPFGIYQLECREPGGKRKVIKVIY